MINIAIVEDNDNDFKVLNDCLNQYSEKHNIEFSVIRFIDGQSFLSQYDYSYSLIFMDIVLDGIDGLEASKELRKKDSRVAIVFFTNMANLVIEGYKVNAADFIIKPISYWNFEVVLNRILPSLTSSEQMKYVVNDGDKKVVLSIFDIMYIEINNHILTFHTKNGLYTLNGSLKEMEESLSKLGFALCDSSYLVNLRYVMSIKKDIVVMKDNSTVPISRRKKKDFFLRLTDFIGEQM